MLEVGRQGGLEANVDILDRQGGEGGRGVLLEVYNYKIDKKLYIDNNCGAYVGIVVGSIGGL